MGIVSFSKNPFAKLTSVPRPAAGRELVPVKNGGVQALTVGTEAPTRASPEFHTGKVSLMDKLSGVVHTPALAEASVLLDTPKGQSFLQSAIRRNIVKELDQRVEQVLERARKTEPADPANATTVQTLRGQLARLRNSPDYRINKSMTTIHHAVDKGDLTDAGASSSALKTLEYMARHLAFEEPDHKLTTGEQLALRQKGQSVRSAPSARADLDLALAGLIRDVSSLEAALQETLRAPAASSG